MLKSILTFLTLLIIAFHFKVEAQNDFNRKGIPLNFSVFKAEDKNLTIHDVLNKDYTFKSSKEFNENTHPEDTYWIKIDLTNELKNLETNSLWFLKLKPFGYGTIYRNKNGAIISEQFGRFENLPKERSILYSPGISFTRQSLIQNKYIILKVKRVVIIDNVNRWRISYRSEFKEGLINKFYNYNDIKLIFPVYIFAGICLIMFLLTFMFYLSSKRIEFLYYSIYVLFLFLYLLADILRLHNLFFGNFNLTSYTFFQQTQVVINLSYVLFIMYYLNTKLIYPKLHIALKVIVYLLIVVIFLDIVFLTNTYFIGHIYLLNFERLVMTLFGLGGMTYLLLKSKNKLSYFIVIGSFLYMTGALGLLFFNDLFYMIFGSALEIIVFAAGLTYKIQQEYKERLQFQHEAYINKTKALRAQINPHFIFNSLSSIQSFITSNDRVSALKYLSKFSRLTRNILESSIETNVVLADEIKMLKDYLELESLRFDNVFNYNITVDQDLDTNTIEVPFMILQPFVENAIIHGLLPKKESIKTLSLSFKKENDYVRCEIEDNGIGRAAASKKQHIHKKEKKSRGMYVTIQRLQSLNQENLKDMIEITDKVDSNQKAMGTKVSIKIPI